MIKNETKSTLILVHQADCPTCKHRFENEVGCASPSCHGRINYEAKQGFVLYQAPTIAQSIRDAAINWPQFLGDVECDIVSSFCDWNQAAQDNNEWIDAIHQGTAAYKMQSRIFMLLVAEALG